MFQITEQYASPDSVPAKLYEIDTTFLRTYIIICNGELPVETIVAAVEFC